MNVRPLDASIQALEELSPMPDDDDPQMTEDLINRYVQLVKAIGESLGSRFDRHAVHALLCAFGPGDGFESYWTTVHLIERFHDNEETYAVVHDAISDGSPGVRKWCCLILGRRRDARDLPYLIERLSDAEERVVIEALDAIRMIACRNSIQIPLSAIEKLASDPRSVVAAAAHNVLTTR